MSGPTCTGCKTGTLSSFFESRLGVCADCCAALVDEARKSRELQPKLQKELEDTKAFIKSMVDSYEAEKLGIEAARRGFELADNPYTAPEQADVRAAWGFGWNRGQLERRTAQAIAVIEWAMPVLDMTNEIALVNGQKEISDKIVQVQEKLGQFV